MTSPMVSRFAGVATARTMLVRETRLLKRLATWRLERCNDDFCRLTSDENLLHQVALLLGGEAFSKPSSIG